MYMCVRVTPKQRTLLQRFSTVILRVRSVKIVQMKYSKRNVFSLLATRNIYTLRLTFII